MTDNLLKDLVATFPYTPDSWVRIDETDLSYSEVKITVNVQRFGCYGMSFRVMAKPKVDMLNHAVWAEIVWSNETPDFLASCKAMVETMKVQLTEAQETLKDIKDCPSCRKRSLVGTRGLGFVFCQSCDYVNTLGVGEDESAKNS